MSRNGLGTYSLPAGNPVVTGNTISSTVQNTTMSDIATALTQSLAYDGQTVPVANLPMNNFRHTGISDGTALTQYASVGQVQSNALVWLSSVSGADTITASAPITPAGYVAGNVYRFVAAATNTTATPTLNISGLGAKTITKNGAAALAVGDIIINYVIEVLYDGTQFQLLAVTSNLIVNGKTGNTSFTAYAPVYGGTTSTGALQSGTVGTSGQFLTSNGAGALPTFQTFPASAIPAGSITAAKLDGAQTGTAPIFGVRAFATWNGATTGTYAPTLPSGNVASITRVSAGLYTITFTTQMTDAEYAWFASLDTNITMGIPQSLPGYVLVSKSAASIQIQFYAYTGSTNTAVAADPTRCSVNIIR